MSKAKNYKVNREYKSTLFTKLFGENKENALSLYNALNNSNYTNIDDLHYTTLDDVVYIHMKNDVSFMIGRTLNLYEHQSSYNRNMPLRGFLYFAEVIKQLIEGNERIYSNQLVRIPTPQYLVFYNGSIRDFPEEIRELRLSDAFELPVEPGKYEWTATLININHGMNPEILSKCAVLDEYSIFVDKVKRYSENLELIDAVDKAVDECLESGILSDFLSKHRKEASNMVLTEFNEENYRKMLREEGIAEGIDIGRSEGIDIGRSELIISMAKSGLSIMQIAAIADLTEEAVQNIIKGN